MAVDIQARGMAAGKADLVNGKVPAEQLPSYVDDVIEKPDYASLPQPGETGKIYITTNDNTTYRWSGSTYVLIGSSGTYRPFPNGQINGTLQQVVSAIMAFPDKKAGMAYLGGIAGACVSDLGLMNAECTVSFMTDSIAVLSLSSSDTIPYHWEYNTASNDYVWKKWSDVSGTYSGDNWQTLNINGTTKNIPGGNSDFVINVTEGDGGGWVSDKTSAQILEAYNGGKNLYCLMSGEIGASFFKLNSVITEEENTSLMFTNIVINSDEYENITTVMGLYFNLSTTSPTIELDAADLLKLGDVSVDQTYNASSTNAQSGVAVAGAILGKLDATKCTYQTTEPTSAITDGGVHIVVLDSEPTTKYDGYIYFIGEE